MLLASNIELSARVPNAAENECPNEVSVCVRETETERDRENLCVRETEREKVCGRGGVQSAVTEGSARFRQPAH